jgi:ATP-binding cassette, subfamily B, bacterial PglK
MSIFKKLLFLLTTHERKNVFILLVMILIMALIDMIGVASILPFMAVITNPDLIETNIVLNSMFQASNTFGIENNQQFIFALGILLFIILITSLTFKALTVYAQVRFVQMREYSIGKRLIQEYLQQPYSWFLNRNSADIAKTILSELQQIVGAGLRPMMDLIAKGTVIITLLTLLIIVEPKLSLILGFSIGGAYGVIFYFVQNYVNRIGKIRLKSNQSRFTSVSEAFGAVKEAKVGGLEKIYIKLFSNSAQTYARTHTSLQVVAQLPRFILEAIAFGGIILLILYKMNQQGGFINALPVISLYVFAGYRLMPALQQAYASYTQLSFIGPSLDKLYEDLKNLEPFNENQDQGILSLNQAITFKNIYFNYPNTSRMTLKNINLIIPAKSTVAFVGATGSGKTTAIDIILGLLEVNKGSLEVDGKVITKQNSRSWQKSIGYVPQHIYLSDDTIAANIAFGVDANVINQKTIEKVAKIANLHEFVVDELPKQYQTTVGERGVRLSGGQRQRIGIARALYHNPQVLILDEATSALDNQTEKVVMNSLHSQSKNITVILIAHRLSTVKNCDTIFLLDKGQLKGKGTFEELIKNNDQFRKSAKIN